MIWFSVLGGEEDFFMLGGDGVGGGDILTALDGDVCVGLLASLAGGCMLTWQDAMRDIG